MAHEARTDFPMTFLLIHLLIFGGGRWSVDLKIAKIFELIRNNADI